MNQKQAQEKFLCSNCAERTNHIVLFEHRHGYPLEIFDKGPDGTIQNSAWIVAIDNYKMVKCMGCDTPSLAVIHELPKKHPDKDSNVTVFPTRLSRKPPPWARELPENLMEMFFEVYRALSNKMPRLALMGARTIFDMVALNKVGDKGSFKSKLLALEEIGAISKKQSEILYVALDAGSAAPHRGFKEDEDIICDVLDVIENSLIINDDLERKANRIGKQTPKRSGQTNLPPPDDTH